MRDRYSVTEVRAWCGKVLQERVLQARMGHHARGPGDKPAEGAGSLAFRGNRGSRGKAESFPESPPGPPATWLSGAAHRSQSGQRIGRERTRCSPKARPLRGGWQGGLAACLEVSLSEQTDQDSLALRDILPPSGC